MEETSQRPVLHVAAGQDLSDVIVRLIRDHCGMKGCTIKEIQKLILGTYEVEISDDLDLCRMILISCQKSIRHGRLFRHGCKFRVSFSELSLDPPLSNGATLVAEKSSGGEKSTVFVCELCKENGEGGQAACVNIATDGPQSESSVWTTIDVTKKCCLCQSQTQAALTTDEISTANSSLLNSSLVDTKIVSSSTVPSASIPTKNVLGDEERLSTASTATAGVSNTGGHADSSQENISTSPLSKQNCDIFHKTRNAAPQPTAQNPDSPQRSVVLKWGRNSGPCSPDGAENGDGGGRKARKSKNRRTQVKFLTDGLTPFYSSDGKRKRPSLPTGCSPVAPKPKKLRLSLESSALEDPGQSAIGRAEGASLLGTGLANLPRLTVENRRKKRWLDPSQNHGSYQLEHGVKEDILFPHITEDDVKMFELARSHAQQRLQQSGSLAPNPLCCQPEQATVVFLSAEEEQRSRIQSSQEHRGASEGGISTYDSVVTEVATSLLRILTSNGGADVVVPAESRHPGHKKPESDIPRSNPASLVDNPVDSSAEDDDNDIMNDDFADDIDDDVDNSICENKEVGKHGDNKNDTDDTFDDNSLADATAGATSDIEKGKDNTLGGISDGAIIAVTSDGASIKAAEGKNGASGDIFDAVACGNLTWACEKPDEETSLRKSGFINHRDVSTRVTATTMNGSESGTTTTNNCESGAMTTTYPESDCTNMEIDNHVCTAGQDGDGSVSKPSNSTHSDCSLFGNGRGADGKTVLGDDSNFVMKDSGLVPAAMKEGEDVVVQEQRKTGDALGKGSDMSSGEATLADTSVVVDDHTCGMSFQQQLVSGGGVVLNSLETSEAALVERGQNTVTRDSGENSMEMNSCNVLKEKKIGKDCESNRPTDPASLPAAAAEVSSCNSSLSTAVPPVELNSSAISTCDANVRADSADAGILSVSSKLGQVERDQTPSKDQYSENVASCGSSLPVADVLPKGAVLDLVPDGDGAAAAAPDVDPVALPSKRNRKRKRFFCPDGCCSMDSDTHCGTKKPDEIPVKSMGAGCPPKGAKQRPSPQPSSVAPKVPRPRGRPRKNPLPAAPPPEEGPTQTDTLPPSTAPPSDTQSVHITPISAEEMANCGYKPVEEFSGDANKTFGAMHDHSLDLNTVSAMREVEADAATKCVPSASVSDATTYRSRAEHDSSGDDDIANAFDSDDDESMLPACAVAAEVSATVATALAGILSIEAVDLGVETIDKDMHLVHTDLFTTNGPRCFGTDSPIGLNFPSSLGSVMPDGVTALRGGVDERGIGKGDVASSVQGVEMHEKDVEPSDKVMGRRCDREMCVLLPGQAFEKDVLLSKSVVSTFQPQLVTEAASVSEIDAHSCSERRSRELLPLDAAAEESRSIENDAQTCSVEAHGVVKSGTDVEVPGCVLDQNAQSTSRRTDSFEQPEINVAVTKPFERDVQSCNIVTGSFLSELGLQNKHVTEQDNRCGINATSGFELELSDVITQKVFENNLQSYKAVPKPRETDFVEASVYHYLNSAPQVIAKNDQSCGVAVSNCVTAEMIDRGKTAGGSERANIAEKNLYQCTITQECHIQNTDVLLGGNVGMNSCHQRLASGPDGRVRDTPSGDCHLQAATTNLLRDCYNLTTDGHIQVPVEFQVEADNNQIQLTVLPPPDNHRVHVLSDSSSEALMRLVNPSLADCHLQLNSLTPSDVVCAISDHQFAHHPAPALSANTIFTSQNNTFPQTCAAAAAQNQATQHDSPVTFLNGATAAAMQVPTNASNAVNGGNVQDGTWQSVQQSNLLYALPLQAPSPLANFGLNFPSNVMYALPIQSMVTGGMNFERPDPPPDPSGATSACNKPESTSNQSTTSGPCPVHAHSAHGGSGLMPQLLGCQPYIIICPGSLPISSILQPLSESLGQILPYICSPQQTDPRHLSCHSSSVLGNFLSPLQQYSWAPQTQNTPAPPANNIGQYAKISTERNPAVELFAPVPGHAQQLVVENEQQSALLGACSISHDSQAFTSVNTSQLIGDSLLASSSQFVNTQNIPMSLSIRTNQTDFSSVPIQVHSSGFIFPPGK